MPLFENAWRANHGMTIEAHRHRMGKLLSELTEIAAGNPYARFPHVLSPEQITDPTIENRMVCFPYTKRMCASLDVDKSTTVLMTSVSKAKAHGHIRRPLGLLVERGDADEFPWFVSERPELASCHAMKISAQKALTEAGISVGKVDLFDLYSCFHIAIQLAREEMGIPRSDPRPFSVTGGLPYAGQAGAIAGWKRWREWSKRLRDTPGQIGMVTGNGWYLTKQSTGIYCSEPKEKQAGKPSQSEQLPVVRPVEIVPEGEKAYRATVETYTVAHSREGTPDRGLIIGRTDDGRRFIADTPTSQDLLEDIMKKEIIGLPGKTRDDGKGRIFDLI